MLLPALALLLAGGCSTQGKFPSLARRAQEDVPGRVAGTVQPAPAAPVVTLPPVTGADDNARLGELRTAANVAHERFVAARPRADQLTAAARDTAPGSDAWAAASVALSDLTTQHDALVGLLADIEAIDVRQRVDGGDGGAIAAVRDQVTAWVADEDAVLADLGGRLRN
ncbi:MAG TPA: hypothetical protein VI199_14665 [Novosphingobium sp.]